MNKKKEEKTGKMDAVSPTKSPGIIGLKIHKSIHLNLRLELYEIAEIELSSLGKKTFGWVYFAEVASGHVAQFLCSSVRLQLGEQELAIGEATGTIEGGYPIAPHTELQIYIALQAEPFLRKQVEKGLKQKQAYWEGKFKRDGWSEEPPTQREALREVMAELGCGTYMRLVPVQKEELLKLTNEEINGAMDDYLTHGWELAEELHAVMRAGLIQFTAEERNKRLMKYRPHVLMIKPPKVGMSTISTRVGLNIDQISPKSIEGFADSEGRIQHSSLHHCWGHVNLDEFLEMQDFLLQHAFNFLELGQFETHKAGRQIKNYGAPRLCFTANPPDVEGLDFSKLGGEDSLTEIDGQMHFNEDAGRMLYSVFKISIGKLTSVSGAAFSRLGVVVFNPGILPVQKREDAQDSEYYEKVDAVAVSILEHTREEATQIFYDCEDWLNLPLPEYNSEIDALLSKTKHSTIKNAWAGQKEAYRHVRGHALSEAIVGNLPAILRGTASLDKLKKDAECSLAYVCSINLDSLRTTINAFVLFEGDAKALALQIKSLRPGYVPALLLGYSQLPDLPEGMEVSLEMLRAGFEKTPRENREEILGGYAFWGRFEGRLNYAKMQKALKGIGLGGIVKSVKQFVKQKKAMEILRSAFVEMGITPPPTEQIEQIEQKIEGVEK